MTPQELAKAYAETINGPANAWGQYIHPTLGQSHVIMHKLSQIVGHDECQHIIKEAIAEWFFDANNVPIEDRGRMVPHEENE